ncbi:MAG: formylglycine-generating enzyme family protein, partial [Leptospiraceae bacterium]|nr:formylglycine-generating enzyme family protein [Leptospiraceae bacterium]
QVLEKIIGAQPQPPFPPQSQEKNLPKIRILRIATIFGIIGLFIVAIMVSSGILSTDSRQPAEVEPEKSVTTQSVSEEPEEIVIEPKMVRIPAGTFLMGSPESEIGRNFTESPQHEVSIGYAFEIGKYEVTFEEYDAFAQSTFRKLPDDNGWGRGNRPVINVNFNDAEDFAQWLSKKTGKNYRLPTEAEWEYAARAETQTSYWWGDDIGDNNAVCDGCGSRWDKARTAPVGSFKANGFGLHDMTGNVSEWVQDCLNRNYNNAPADGSAWLTSDRGGGCHSRVKRGGSWFDLPSGLRSASRSNSSRGNFDLGFRIVKDL